jgi:hypothetical protein
LSVSIPFYKLLDIAFSYQPPNHLLQGITLFGIMSLVLVKHAILIGGACIRSGFYRRGVLDKKFLPLMVA